MLKLVLNGLIELVFGELVFGVAVRLSVVGLSLFFDFGAILSMSLAGFGQVYQRVKLKTVAIH